MVRRQKNKNVLLVMFFVRHKFNTCKITVDFTSLFKAHYGEFGELDDENGETKFAMVAELSTDQNTKLKYCESNVFLDSFLANNFLNLSAII